MVMALWDRAIDVVIIKLGVKKRIYMDVSMGRLRGLERSVTLETGEVGRAGGMSKVVGSGSLTRGNSPSLNPLV